MSYTTPLLAQGQLAQTAITWIVVAVVLLVLLLGLVVGLVSARRRRVRLRGGAPGETPEQPPEGYRSTGQISFSAGAATAEPEAVTDSAPAPPQPAPQRPAPQAPPAEQAPTKPSAPAEPSPPARSAPAEPEAAPAPSAPAEPSAPAPSAPAEPSAAPSDTAPAAPKAEPSAPTEPPTPVEPPVPDHAAPGQTAPGQATPGQVTPEQAVPGQAAPSVPERAEPGEPSEPIEPPEGRLERLRGRLAGSRSAFGQGLLGLLGGGELDEESWEEVEDTLLMADLGADTTVELVGKLRTELASRGVRTPDQARQALRAVLVNALSPALDRSVRALPHDGRPAIVLVVGVNGTGKTTTTGKLARVLVAGGHTVVLGAADTFRAAAAEQLATWGERAGAEVVRGKEGADPASVAFEAVKRAAEDGADVALLDTAGRLHTKTGLMDELGKLKRVVSRHGDVDEVLLVLDATTGQNGVVQAKIFAGAVDVTGIVLTKLDGTAKGGIVFRVQRELGVPVKLVGLGEGADDLAPFEPEAFVDALLN